MGAEVLAEERVQLFLGVAQERGGLGLEGQVGTESCVNFVTPVIIMKRMLAARAFSWA